jgi:transposase
MENGDFGDYFLQNFHKKVERHFPIFPDLKGGTKMLTEAQKAEIRKLKKQGLSISEISRRTCVDWKTAQKAVAQNQDHGVEDPAESHGKNDSANESELTKITFRKLNSGASPAEVIAEIGHAELVIDLYKKWRMLNGDISKNQCPSDPKIFRSLEAWVESVGKYPEWHEKMGHRFLAGFAWMRLSGCANYKNSSVECPQIRESNPYECLGCLFYSPGNRLTSDLDF